MRRRQVVTHELEKRGQRLDKAYGRASGTGFKDNKGDPDGSDAPTTTAKTVEPVRESNEDVRVIDVGPESVPREPDPAPANVETDEVVEETTPAESIVEPRVEEVAKADEPTPVKKAENVISPETSAPKVASPKKARKAPKKKASTKRRKN